MIRAKTAGGPPQDVLDFLHDTSKQRPLTTFLDLLKHWYQDDSDGSWFAPWANVCFPEGVSFANATFILADFSNARFSGAANLQGARFQAASSFGNATFCGPVHFEDATFRGGVSFARATFVGSADFSRAIFHGEALFLWARFGRGVEFLGTTFGKGAEFSLVNFRRGAAFFSASFNGPIRFERSTIAGRLLLGADVSETGSVLIDRVDIPGRGGGPNAPQVCFGPMSLTKVQVRMVDPRNFRLAHAAHIEDLSLFGTSWPSYRVQDEDDMEAGYDPTFYWGVPHSVEVERIYRGLRKNHEDLGDRVGAHGWFVAEMELGRHEARWFSFKRFARAFYWHTSRYGFSATWPLFWLVVVIGLAFLAFTVSGLGVCPAAKPPGRVEMVCVSWSGRLEVLLLAVALQSPPGGVVFSGLIGQVIWLAARVAGAAMLLSIGLAFRNQVAR